METNRLLEKIQKVEHRIQELEMALEDPSVVSNPEKLTALTKEHSRLVPIVKKSKEFQGVLRKIHEASDILESSSDTELRDLAREELEENKVLKETLEHDLKILLIPKDPRDGKGAIMEIRAGTGGEEAALFAGDLYRTPMVNRVFQ